MPKLISMMPREWNVNKVNQFHIFKAIYEKIFTLYFISKQNLDHRIGH